MIKSVNIQTTIKNYKNNPENQGKIAIYDIASSTIILEGSEDDWAKLQDEVDKKNVNEEIYHLIIVPHSDKLIRSFSWR